MTSATPYTEGFYRDTLEGSRRSAAAVVPLVLEILRPTRVIDVGCGMGSWLAVLKEHSVHDVLGVDGDHIDRKMLQIPAEQFLARDLRAPLRLDRVFDLAISLEVAEHLPEECAGTFVDSLVGLAPVILFSAAIPFQGGTNHLNEQWPEYWAQRFRQRGYVAIDCLRRRLWENDAVEWWYAQNTVLFAQNAYAERNPMLGGSSGAVLPLVHPRNYEWKALALQKAPDLRKLPLKRVFAALPILTVEAVKKRIKALM